MRNRVFTLCTVLLALACAPDDPVSPRIIEPPCENPAPLYLPPDSISIRDTYIVVYPHDLVNADSVTTALMQKYRFTPRFRWSSPKGLMGFSAKLNAASVAGLRCESVVKYMERVMYIYVGQ